MMMTLPSGQGQIRRIIQVDGNVISILLSHKMTNTIFNVVEYPSIRELYRQYVDAQEDRIVLKKSAKI